MVLLRHREQIVAEQSVTLVQRTLGSEARPVLLQALVLAHFPARVDGEHTPDTPQAAPPFDLFRPRQSGQVRALLIDGYPDHPCNEAVAMSLAGAVTA